jgi:3',5'-cyclic AMP phosphodiesterase CpdA
MILPNTNNSLIRLGEQSVGLLPPDHRLETPMPSAQVVLAHLSDLHFASQSHPPRHWPGHAPVLCTALPGALADIASWATVTTADVHLVVTGDISDSGQVAEFTTADTFLTSWTGGNFHRVPGNRDHYSPGWSACPTWLAPPWPVELSPQGPLSVELYGVDSVSGMQQPHGQPRPGASGEIADPEFADLEARLIGTPPRPGAKRVRILLCHHTLQPSSYGMSIGARELELSSRQRLLRLAADHGIQVLLTGHAHDTLAYRHPATSSQGAPANVVELRASTTLSKPTRVGNNGLWGYRIVLETNGDLWWESRLYHWVAGTFSPINTGNSPATWYRRFPLA